MKSMPDAYVSHAEQNTADYSHLSGNIYSSAFPVLECILHYQILEIWWVK
jgi:hypothetical protein